MNKKNIINLIKKMAQSKPLPDVIDPISNTSGGTTTSQYKDPEITKVQESLISLSKLYSSQLTQQGQNSFADYVSNHYSGKELANVMSQMSAKSGGFSVDGRWGPKTTNAIKNAATFAEALLKMSKELGFYDSVKSIYSFPAVQDIFQAIAGIKNDPINSKKKIELAQSINQGKYIDAIISLYNEIKNIISNTPSLAQFTKIKPEPKLEESKEISPEIINSLDKIYSFDLQFTTPAGIQSAKITPANFANINTLKSWQKETAPNVPVTKIIAELKKQVLALR